MSSDNCNDLPLHDISKLMPLPDISKLMPIFSQMDFSKQILNIAMPIPLLDISKLMPILSQMHISKHFLNLAMPKPLPDIFKLMQVDSSVQKFIFIDKILSYSPLEEAKTEVELTVHQPYRKSRFPRPQKRIGIRQP